MKTVGDNTGGLVISNDSGKIVESQENRMRRVKDTANPQTMHIIMRYRNKQERLLAQFWENREQMMNAYLGARIAEKRVGFLDSILEGVEADTLDSIEQQKTNYAVNQIHRKTQLLDAERANLEAEEKLEAARRRTDKPETEDAEARRREHKEKVRGDFKANVEIRSMLSKDKRDYIKRFTEEKYNAIDEYVETVKRREGREIDLANREDWSVVDEDQISMIEYDFDGLIQDVKNADA